MPVYKDDKGKYYVSMRLPDPVTGKSKKVLKRGFNTKKEAQSWEANARIEKKVVGTSITFWEVFQVQLDANDTSKSTRKKKEAWITKYFANLKDRPIKDIKRSELVSWRNDLKNFDISTTTKNYGLQFVRSVFAFHADVYGGKNEATVLKNFRKTNEEKIKEMQVWSVEEFNRFLKEVDGYILKAYFTFLYWSGCRRGEAIALCKEDFNGNKVHIHRSMRVISEGFKPLKTASSERTITIDDRTMQILKPCIANASPFVFGGDYPITPFRIEVAFREAVKKSGVKKIRIHDLRHSHASLLLNNGINIVAVSKRLGHATVTQTLDTYTHLMDDSNDKLIEFLNNKNSKNK